MRSPLVVVLVAVLLLIVSATACSPGGAVQESGGAGGATETLTRATLPTDVGTTWTVIRRDVDGTPLALSVEGPWNLQAGPDWSVNTYEIVDPATVPGIDGFPEYTYVTALWGGTDSPDYYYPREVTDEWVMGLGRITVSGDVVTPEPSEPSRFWPLELEVGKKYEVRDTEEGRIEAEVLARNSATLPAGTLENAYLVRFRSTKTSGETTDYYYLFAPNVGMAAYFSGLTGSEADGFTAADSIVLLATMPQKP